jgi:hypothetical protein
MAEEKNEEWLPDDWEFANVGWYTKPSLSYVLMLEFLRLSPTYELARKTRSGEITRAEKKKLPKDFDQVLATYDLIGDVNKIIFRFWWVQRGIKVFGKPYRKPEIKVIDSFAHEEEIDTNHLQKNLEINFVNERSNEGQPPAMLLSIPLTMNRTDIFKKLKTILDENPIQKEVMPNEPLIKIISKRFHKMTIIHGLRLLYLRSILRDNKLWELGFIWGNSKKYSLRHPSRKEIRKDPDKYERMVLTNLTYRMIRKYELMVENAARGRFPCDDPIEYPKFDYLTLWDKEEGFRDWRKANMHDPHKFKY